MKKKNKVGNNIEAKNASWTFSGIEKNFEKHISTSVPMYNEAHEIALNISDFFLKDNSKILDIGCSTGSFLKKLILRTKKKNLKLIGVDSVSSMIKFCKKKNSKKIKFFCQDYLKFRKSKFKYDFISAFFTLQFVPPPQRQIFINKIFKELNWGGAFVLFEKIRGPDARFQDIFNLTYQEFKLSKGLTEEEIVNKSRSLKGIMEPFSDAGNIALLKRAGFSDITGVFQWMCFKGYLAIK
ncbi:methyltransferase domain-containing protein [Candidatus Pelagibacter sp.]|jgi:tRNA (cmo5U34)-methyltransferase|nr:methyltransferase domain-containing protein [Candidatus Pelagibacter sp.]